MSSALIVIPSRLAALRLPRKPLATIQGLPMVIQTMKRALESGVGPVYVACCGEEIANLVIKHGGKALMTDPDLPSGTDRVFSAALQVDPEGKFDKIINLQGDLPFIDPTHLKAVIRPLLNENVHISTVAAEIIDSEEINNPAVVKIALGQLEKDEEGYDIGRASYFSRQAIPANAEIFYHHIGLYGYKRSALHHFVSLPPSRLEKIEKLEQLRALEGGMRIDVAMVKGIPQSVDTPEDLKKLQGLI